MAIVRLATNADVPEIVRIVRAVYEEYGFTWEEAGYHADLYDVDAHYTGRGHCFFVAQPGGDPNHNSVAGTAALKLFDAIPGEPGEVTEQHGKRRLCGADSSLDRLYVEPGARKHGLGSALFRIVCKEAQRRGRRMLEIWSDKRFVDAHRLYQRFGAKSVAERVLDDPDQSPEWGLLLPLDGLTD